MDAEPAPLYTLTPAEAALVSGGFDSNEFLASAAYGAAYGAPIGAVLLGPINTLYGAAMGALLGGFFGGGYYVGSELIDYCF
jgi:hypothetical protein